MEIIKLNSQNKNEVIAKAVEILSQGGIVVYPTETCYGIGVDATNQTALDKLIKYKSQRNSKPFSVAVTGSEMASKYAEINEAAANIYKNLLPGPITVVSKYKSGLANGVVSIDSKLGVRIPDYDLVLGIVEKLGKPITSSSANASHKKRPYSINDILENISDKQKSMIDLIIDAGTLPPNPPSTVVDTTTLQHQILRQGNINFNSDEEFNSDSAEATQQVGEDLMTKYKQYLGYKSVIFALNGELGAGKTQFTKGIARALGIEANITSPTFIIENIYHIKGVEGSYLESRKTNLFHIDAWRLESSEQLEALGLVEQIEQNNVFAIEWADKIVDYLKQISVDAIVIWVNIENGKNESDRLIKVRY